MPSTSSCIILPIQISNIIIIESLIHIYLFMKGDVYPVEPSDGFSVKQVLDAHWGVLNDEDVRN